MLTRLLLLLWARVTVKSESFDRLLERRTGAAGEGPVASPEPRSWADDAPAASRTPAAEPPPADQAVAEAGPVEVIHEFDVARDGRTRTHWLCAITVGGRRREYRLMTLSPSAPPWPDDDAFLPLVSPALGR